MVDKTSADAIQHQKKKRKGGIEPSFEHQAGLHNELSSVPEKSTHSSKKSKKKDKLKAQSDIAEQPADSVSQGRSNNVDDDQEKKEKKRRKKDKGRSEVNTDTIDSASSQLKEKSKKRKVPEEEPSSSNHAEPNDSSPQNKKNKPDTPAEIDTQVSHEADVQEETFSNSNRAENGEKKKKKSKKNKSKQPDQAPPSSVVEESSSTKGKDKESDKPTETVDDVQESTESLEKKDKADVQDRLDALMENVESKSRGVVHRSRKSSGSGQPTRQAGSNRKTNKDYFLQTLDSQLTHEDMLAKELFYYNQLRWLEEERGLKVKKGPFDKSEEEIIKNKLDEFKEKLEMDQNSFNDFVLEKREDKERAEQYSTLWQEMTAMLVGRPNRSVRTHVRRNLTNYVYKTGPWTEEEQKALEDGVKEHGLVWFKIAKKINRSPEHCRLRWRDYKGDGKLQRQKGKWSNEEDEKLRKAVDESEVELKESVADEEKGNAFWDHVCEKMEGARSGRQCESRWRIMNPKDGKNNFYSQPTDGPILINLLHDQANEAHNDNFSDVDLKKILHLQPNWTVKIIKRAWRSMVDRFVIKKEQEDVDHYQDFRNRLRIIKESLENLQKQKTTDESKKRKRRPTKKDSEDLIESDNEVDLLTRNGDEEGVAKTDESSSNAKKKKKKSGSKEKRKKQGEESDDSIG
ncbi:hypothetical protein L7F22_043649 [Adiantum nelumboides]|nr:hypothetical protein [Adiantum nelumboides]